MSTSAEPAAEPRGTLTRVSFVIPVRDDAARLKACLASIRANDYPSDCVESVVADNDSRDDSAEVARGMGAVVVTVPGQPVGAVRNQGAQVASGDVLAFVDADHVIDPQWVRCAVETLARSGAVATGALCHAPQPGSWVQRAYDRLRSRTAGIREVQWLGSGNLAIRRNVFLSLGGFDTTLESCEDVDLCNRLRAAGHKLVSDDRLLNIHMGDPRTLRALFLGELWRGRDNLRVTLRGPFTLRALPSILIPFANLAFVAAAVLGLVAAPWIGLWLAVAGIGAFGVMTVLRSLRMMRNDDRGSVSSLLANVAVAATYELARALALVVGTTYRTRRQLTSQ